LGLTIALGSKGASGRIVCQRFFTCCTWSGVKVASASALRELEVQVKAQIVAYGEAQSESCQGEQPIGICMGSDETFFGLPILVAVELASGFIFSEAVCENRTYETWWEQVSEWFNREQWDCRGLVSDEAKALVKLALSGLVVSASRICSICSMP